MQKTAIFGSVAGAAGLAWYKTAPAETQFAIMSALGPTFRLLDPEITHVLGIEAAKWGLFPKETRPDPAVLRTQLWDRAFPNPIGGCLTMIIASLYELY
jgi:dihydroorotate dehydrogenase